MRNLKVLRRNHPRRGIATGVSQAKTKPRLMPLAFARSRPECVSANAAISASPRRIRRSQCTRSRARDSSLTAPPTECLSFTLAAHVRQMFRLARIHRQIFRPRVLAHDHAGINFFLRANKQFTSRLNIVKRIGGARTSLHRHHYAAVAS